jgi:hypothetical protein
MALSLVTRGWQYGRDLVHLCFPRPPITRKPGGVRLHLPLQLFGGVVARASRTIERHEHVRTPTGVRPRYRLSEAASLAHCQNVSAAGLSVPFRAASPMGTIFGSGVSGNIFTRRPKA